MSDGRLRVAQLAMREDWLGSVTEEALEPEREIVDPHHHLWDRPGARYVLDELQGDARAGHNVVQSIFIECREQWDEGGPEHLRPVGETRFVKGVADASRAEGRPVLAGIVANADLELPTARLDEVLDAHRDVAGDLFLGIRHSAASLPDKSALSIPGRAELGLYRSEAFRAGLRRLGERGLTYDAWHYHPQNAEFLEAAKAAPQTTIVLDHLGTPLGVGEFEGRRAEIFARWKDDMAAIAECPNVVAKLGGFAMPDNGWGWHEAEAPPSSDRIVETQGEWYAHMIACFGPDRCMFESNFPVDRASVGYGVLWNAFKKMTAGFDEAARAAMFAGTARRAYGI